MDTSSCKRELLSGMFLLNWPIVIGQIISAEYEYNRD